MACYENMGDAWFKLPVIEKYPVVMECELEHIIRTEMFHAVERKIVNTSAEEKILGENGKIDPSKVEVLIFDQLKLGYYVIGEKVGQAWNAGAGLMK